METSHDPPIPKSGVMTPNPSRLTPMPPSCTIVQSHWWILLSYDLWHDITALSQYRNINDSNWRPYKWRRQNLLKISNFRFRCCRFVILKVAPRHQNWCMLLESNVPSKLGAHINVPSKNVFAHISYTSFQIQMSPSKMLLKGYFMHTQTLKN